MDRIVGLRVKLQVNHNDTNLYHCNLPETVLYRSSRRGESNSLRKGKSKIHRRNQPLCNVSAPKGMASKLFGCITTHDWNRNAALILLRQRGYTPFTRQFDPDFKPKPMRISVRSESREALTALHFVLAANCDFNPESEYPFEVMVPFEEIARQMGVLHKYENGRLAYDVALHALRVTEELKQLYVDRDWDSDKGQYKAVRIFLTTDFFTSKGINIDELRSSLNRFRQWARKNGLSQTLKQRNERHLLRLERLNLSIEKKHALKKLLKKVKWQITSPELQNEKQEIIDALSGAIEQKSVVVPLRQRSAKYRWFKWESCGSSPTFLTKRIQSDVDREFPSLRQDDEERYYSLLLERAGQH